MLASLRFILSKIVAVFRRSRVEEELDQEIQHHLAQLERRFIDRGMTADQARYAARREFGGIQQLKESHREQYSFAWLDHVRRDVRIALRGLLRNPGFSIVAILTLALGIGANTAIFSVINGVLLRPLPYKNGEGLVLVRQELPLTANPRLFFSVHDVEDYRSQNQTFSSLVEYHEMSFVLLGGEEAERVQTGVVSWDFFDVLGVKPLLGRNFVPGDETHGADAVLLLSYNYWQNAFGGDPSIVGRVFQMNDRPHTVIGVLPPVPQFPQDNDVYMPTSACPFRSAPAFIANRESRMMGVLGRLKPGVSLESAQADLGVIANRLQQQYPDAYPKSGGYRTDAVLLKDQLTQDIRPALWVLLCAAGFVLLIVCASVANLTLARLLQRDREIVVRAAIGASRMQLVRQLFTESIILATAGGAIGLILASAGLDVLVAFAAKFTSRAAEIQIDGWVLFFTAVVSIGIGLLSGIIPAFTSRNDLAGALRDASSRMSSSPRHHKFRSAFIVAEVAIAFVLLISAGLMVRTLIKLQRVDPGVRAENILTARVDLNFSKYRDAEKTRRFYRELLDALRKTPDVVSAGAGSTFPLNTQRPQIQRLRIQGKPFDEGPAGPRADVLAASPGYFQTLGIPLLEGRDFSDSDRADQPGVVIVNRSMAKHYWGASSPIGQQISVDGKEWFTVVGIVADSRKALDLDVADTFYVPLEVSPFVTTIVVRTAADPMKTARLVRETVHKIDADQPVDRVRTLQDLRSDSLSSPRLMMTLLSLFAGLALLITATGIGGVIGFFVSQRRHEIGVRMALGAERNTVLWMILRERMTLVVIGVSLGSAGAFALAHLMNRLLFGIRPTDPATFISVALVLMGVAAAACFIPARRASAIDPLIALRNN